MQTFCPTDSGDWEAGGKNPLFLIAGPCVIESEEHTLRLARELKAIAEERGIHLIFKASFDKANRTSVHSFRGPGLEEGLRILSRVKSELNLPLLSDIHDVTQVEAASEVLDVLQIPAFLCRQTDLILAAAKSGKTVNVKKGQFLAPGDVEHIVEKATSAGASRILITERGTSFGYNNLVVDFRGIPAMRRYGFPLVFDATHSVQLPGGGEGSSAGQSEYIFPLARAAVAVGVDGLFVEVHDRPEAALSDGPNALQIDKLNDILLCLEEIDRITRSRQLNRPRDCAEGPRD